MSARQLVPPPKTIALLSAVADAQLVSQHVNIEMFRMLGLGMRNSNPGMAPC
jgi:hypothetical protein